MYTKTILCFGDSNTWGYIPGTEGERFPYDQRWTSILQVELGGDYRVIDEGLNGRTTVWDDPIEQHKNGRTYLMPCLESHAPVDLVVLMLGTNDLKVKFSLTAQDISFGAGVLVEDIQRSTFGPGLTAPKVLLVSPLLVGPLTELDEMFAGAEDRSKRFARRFGEVAAQLGVPLLDAASVARASALDGIHLDEVEAVKLGKAMAKTVKALF